MLHIAYADDVNLISTTAFGLQLLLDKFRALALLAGLEINVSKTKLLALRAKKVLPFSPAGNVDGTNLQFVIYEEPARYIGLQFNPSGLVPCDLCNEVSVLLEKLTLLRAKQQQRLYIRREILLPRFHYQFSFYTFAAGTYDFDVKIRKFTRDLLNLPHDVPNSFFYASISDGGLGLFNSRWRGPLLRRNKLCFFAKIFVAFPCLSLNTLQLRLTRPKIFCFVMVNALIMVKRLLCFAQTMEEIWIFQMTSRVRILGCLNLMVLFQGETS